MLTQLTVGNKPSIIPSAATMRGKRAVFSCSALQRHIAVVRCGTGWSRHQQTEILKTAISIVLFSPTSNNSLIRVNEEVNRVFMKRDVSKAIVTGVDYTNASQNHEKPSKLLLSPMSIFSDSKDLNELRILVKDNTSHLNYSRMPLPYSQQLLRIIRNWFKGSEKEVTVFPSTTASCQPALTVSRDSRLELFHAKLLIALYCSHVSKVPIGPNPARLCIFSGA